MDHAASDEMSNLAVTCRIQGTLYGIAATAVQEVVVVGRITPVHRSPPSVLGVMNLRGRIVSVIDLQARLMGTPTTIGPDARIIISSWHSDMVGLLVDSIDQVVEVDESTHPAGRVATGIPGEAVQRIVINAGHPLVILDIAAVLDNGEG